MGKNQNLQWEFTRTRTETQVDIYKRIHRMHRRQLLKILLTHSETTQRRASEKEPERREKEKNSHGTK